MVYSGQYLSSALNVPLQLPSHASNGHPVRSERSSGYRSGGGWQWIHC